MKGFPLHFHLKEGEASRSLGPGKIAGRLFDLGEYPGALPGSGTETVYGEIYELLNPELLDQIDCVEGAPPHGQLFRRTRVRVTCTGGEEVEAWCYFYNGSVSGTNPISSGDYRQFKGIFPGPRGV